MISILNCIKKKNSKPQSDLAPLCIGCLCNKKINLNSCHENKTKKKTNSITKYTLYTILLESISTTTTTTAKTAQKKEKKWSEGEETVARIKRTIL